MKPLNVTNKWVLVTGASSGLGYEMALQLATIHGANIIAVARRKEKLEELQQAIAARCASQTIILAADLSKPEDIDMVVQKTIGQKGFCAAILNAGITFFGKHIEQDWAQFGTMLQTNVSGMVRMTQQLTQWFEKEQSEGGIMVVSSMAAVLPTPFQATYSGTKGFMLNYITALAREASNRQLSYTVYLPGGMATEMTDNDKFSPLKKWLMPVEEAAAIGLKAFIKRKQTSVPGLTNKLGAIASGIIPKNIIIKGMAKTYGNALKKQQ
ncbi:MAG: SDR family NAD(P)-dependent oxidoreductase [Edaphocola sp.]